MEVAEAGLGSRRFDRRQVDALLAENRLIKDIQTLALSGDPDD